MVLQLRQLADDSLVTIEQQRERIRLLEEEVARLRGGNPPASAPKGVPPFVKANRPERVKKARKPRDRGHARRREKPTHVVKHVPENCSDCGRKLRGGWVQASRQVIDIPSIPYQVIEHQFLARQCGICGRREFSRPDLSGEVLGQSRLGIRLMSYIACLDADCRMPVKAIQGHLQTTYGLHLSEGEIVRVLHTVADAGAQEYAQLLDEVRRSRVLHADETGSREDGRNGYIWSLSTPTIRFYHRDPSRGSAVIQKLLGYDPTVYQARTARGAREARAAQPPQGERFKGLLVSDFYAAYAWYPGPHQYCLVHLDRDLDELKAAHAGDATLATWVGRVLDLIQKAKAYIHEHPDANPFQRRRARDAFENDALALARPYCRSGLPNQTLAERIRKFIGGLFAFVEHAGAPADNNLGERAIRPFVIMRKVSGGTRSKRGSDTQSVLLSLFQTWKLRGQDALPACQSMLANRPALASV